MNKYETEKSDINQYNILWKIQISWSNSPRSFVNSKSDYNPQRTWLTIDKINPINYPTFVRRIFIRPFLSFDITNILNNLAKNKDKNGWLWKKENNKGKPQKSQILNNQYFNIFNHFSICEILEIKSQNLWRFFLRFFSKKREKNLPKVI